MSWEKDFSELAEEYFPGSSQKIPRRQPSELALVRSAPKEPESWDANPRKYEINGQLYEFFTIGHLAAALGKATVTIRLWEQQGFIPNPDRSPSAHADKRHRIYSRAQIEGIVRIAGEEGILYAARPRIRNTRFADRVLDLFIELAKSDPQNGAVPLEEAA
ncbi:MerR family transcriptional regulator [Streptomyces luteogriseus]|uniref:MerR family transcriptional regulator n=1 Tax=Streptomyces luteogriseus TaxID=68233 RepID=UPI0037A1BD69